MFTGIIRHKCKIKKVSKKEELLVLDIESPELAKMKKKGDSISVDGACLTVTNIDPPTLSVEVMPESLTKTIISKYSEGSLVNLENPLKIGDTLDGNFVLGHVDFVEKVKYVKKEKHKNTKILSVGINDKFKKFFSLKGSVTINGVNLTISNLESDSFEVSLIPETLKNTNLDNLKTGDSVNIEIDLISRHLDSLLSHKENQISHEVLTERGFL